MSMLSRVQNETKIEPPRIVIHGAGGVGKTTFAASMHKPIFLPCEDGMGILQVAKFPRPSDYAEVADAIEDLLKADHEYRSFVIDTVDYLEPLIWAETCRAHSSGKNKYEHIEDFGYGKGYLYAVPYWTEFLQGLDALRRERAMTVCVLCHNTVTEIKDPNVGPYHKIEPKIEKRANALLYEWSDICGYLETERVAVDTGNAQAKKTIRTAAVTGRRVLHLEDQGSFRAKNRYGLPPEIEIPLENPFEALRSEVLKRIQPAKKDA